MKVQPYVSSEDGKLFDVSFNVDIVSFDIIELTEKEIDGLVSEILTQVELLKKEYQELGAEKKETTK